MDLKDNNRQRLWKLLHGRGVLVGALSAFCTPLATSAEEQEDIARAYGSEEMIALATGYDQSVFDAPATATVVTAEQIRRLGATTLRDVLETISGFHISTPDGRATVTSVRGVTSRVLILVNGTPLAQGLVNAFLSLDNVLLHDVERIEIVRGPGSAMYGADAAAGVLNIITKRRADIDGTEVGALAGSFDTYDGWLLHGSRRGEFDVSLYLTARSTNETDGRIEADAQTALDALFGTEASLAPGPMAGARDLIDARLDLVRGPWGFRMSYFDQNNFHSGAGVALALDPVGTFDTRIGTTELTFRSARGSVWELDGRLTYVYVEQDVRDLTLFPPGAFGGAFPEGVIQELDSQERRVLGELASLYHGMAGHTVRLGAGGFTNDFDNQGDRRNYTVQDGFVVPTGTFGELGGIGDVTIVEDTSRDVYYSYAQDQWGFARDWTLTAGLRWDHYSDFGDTVNPRAGLVWSARHDLNMKLLYGRAFRPPSVTELQSNGIFVGRGDPNLDPVILDMAEVGFTRRSARVETSGAVFRYCERDLIQLIPSVQSPNGLQFANVGQQEGWGLEFDAQWAASQSVSVRGNYSFQERIGDEADDNSNIRYSPRHKIYAQVTWALPQEWNASVDILSVLDRERTVSDPRSSPDDYTLLNVSIERQNVADLLDLSLTVRNVLDEDAREPSNSETSIPFDIPLPGRNVYVQVHLHF